MPRGRYNETMSSSAAAQLAAQRLMNRRDEFQKGIMDIHKYNMVMAESISHGGPMEDSLDATNDGERAAFLVTQRERLKKLAEQNANSFHLIQDMVGAVQAVSQNIASSSSETKNDEEDIKEEIAVDYKALIELKIKEMSEERSRKKSNIKNEVLVKECVERLGEKASGANEDDELEVVNQHDTSNDAALKCPITGQIFKNPYKNKVCNHVYDYDAIISHLRLKNQCPVPGCGNSYMNRAQLAEDLEMKMKVRRFMKRQEQEDRLKMSQQYEKDYDDDDEEEDNNGTTFIR